MFLNGPLEDSTDENQNEADPEQAVRKPRVSEKRIAAKGCPLRGVPWLEPRGRTPPVPGQLAGIARQHDGTK